MSAASLRGRLRPREIVIIKLLPDQQLALLVPMLHDDAGLASDGLVFCFHTQWVQPVAAIAVNQLDVLLGEEVAEVPELSDEPAIIGVDALNDRHGGPSLRLRHLDNEVHGILFSVRRMQGGLPTNQVIQLPYRIVVFHDGRLPLEGAKFDFSCLLISPSAETSGSVVRKISLDHFCYREIPAAPRFQFAQVAMDCWDFLAEFPVDASRFLGRRAQLG